jgi:beta-fructofuranosidase
VDDNGVPTFIYSGNKRLSEADPTIREQRTCIATRPDGLRTWTKDPGNPVIPDVPPGIALVQYRDPSAWREGDTWYQVTGSGFPDVGGTVLLYRSDDLRRWEYLHPLYVGDVHRTEPFGTGIMWECPQFFALDGTHMLIISTWDHGPKQTAYFAGDYAGLRFTPRRAGLLDLGWSFFAPQSLRRPRPKGRQALASAARAERSCRTSSPCHSRRACWYPAGSLRSRCSTSTP